MSNLRKSFSSTGYNQEEAYFFQEEQRLIEKSRRANLKLVPTDKSAQKDSEKAAPVPQLPSGLKKVA